MLLTMIYVKHKEKSFFSKEHRLIKEKQNKSGAYMLKNKKDSPFI